MKKSLIALAVAGTFVAAPAFAATSNVDIYGKVRFSLDHNNRNNGGTNNWTANDQTSRVGIKGSEDLGGGLKAVWQWESALNNVDTGGATNVAAGSQRNTFIGLAGGFGTVLAGTHDTPYKLGGSADVFADTSADSQKSTTGIIGRNGFDQRASGTIAYVSPDFNGFHFAAAIVPGEGTTAGSANGLMDAYSLTGVYANGPLKASLSHESYDKKIGAGASDKDATKFNIGYKMGDIGLGYTYERSDVNYTSTTKDVSQLASVTYGMGPITLAAQYGKFNDKQAANADLTRWTLGAIYSMSKRTNVYAAYNSDNLKPAASVDTNTFTFGINHDF